MQRRSRQSRRDSQPIQDRSWISTARKTEKLALVLDDYRQYYQSLQDQLDDLRSTGKTRIMQILNPEQRDKFEKMMTDLAPQLTGAKQ